MSAKKDAFAALLACAKQLVMETFEFDKAFSIMRAVHFGWASPISLNHNVGGADRAREILESLIDGTVADALELVEKGEPWGVTWTSSGGFIVFVFDTGIIQAHMSLVNSDTYDYEELLPLYEQYETSNGNAPPPRDSYEYGGRTRRILMLHG